MEVTINATADQVVALESALAAPRGPNAVWLPCPPNAAEISPLLPLCSRTTMIMKRQTRMWMGVMREIISYGIFLEVPGMFDPAQAPKIMIRKGGFELLHHVDNA